MYLGVFGCVLAAPKLPLKIVPPFKYMLIRHAENNGNSGFGGVLRETAPNPLFPLFPLFSACRISTYLKGGTILGAPGIHTKYTQIVGSNTTLVYPGMPNCGTGWHPGNCYIRLLGACDIQRVVRRAPAVLICVYNCGIMLSKNKSSRDSVFSRL